jgi:iron(III) transport system permease protein
MADRDFAMLQNRPAAGTKLPRMVCLLAFTAIVFGPLAALILDAAGAGLPGTGFPGGRQLGLLLRTLAFGGGVAAMATLVGFAAATRLWHWRRPVAAQARWFAPFMVIVPPYVHALAWSAAFNAINRQLQYLGLQHIPFQGWCAAWWVNSMALCPIAIGMTLLGLESVDITLVESARIMTPDGRCLRKIVAPLAAPHVLAGGAFVFLLSITDYTVPSLFNLNVYPLEIFAVYSATGEASRAFLTSLPLLGIALIVLAFAQAPLRDAALKPLWQARVWTADPVWPPSFQFLQRSAAFLFALQILIPLVALSFAARGHLLAAAAGARGEILFSAWTSGVVALACLPMALAAAGRMARKGPGGKAWWFVVTSPLALPGPLVGIGLVWVWNHAGTSSVYGSHLMPALAGLARFTPVAAIVLLAHLRRIDPALLDAAEVFHTSPVKTWAKIRGPMLMPGFVAAACVVFALAAGELGATLVVAPPGQATLTMRIYNYLHYGASQTVAGLCLIMAAIGLVAGVAALVGLRGWARLCARW